MLTLCDPMDCSIPGFLVLQYLREFAQTHVLWVGDIIHFILCCPLLLPSIFPSIRVFFNEAVLHIGGQSIGASVSASVLLMNIQGWFPLWLTGLISFQSKGLSIKSPSAPQFKSINSLELILLYGPTLTYMYDYWKSHSFNYTVAKWYLCFLLYCLEVFNSHTAEV